MNLENIMHSEISQRQILYSQLLVEYKKMKQMNVYSKTKHTHRYENKLVVTSGEREGRKVKTGVED